MDKINWSENIYLKFKSTYLKKILKYICLNFLKNKY